MTRQIALLRGINIGPRNRIAMPKLRESLARAGFDDVQTYVQSGNILLSSSVPPGEVAGEIERLIARDFKLDIQVIARTRAELAEVVRRNPLGDVAVNPKRYQVTFLASEPDPEVLPRLEAAALPTERMVPDGREIYAWHPEGVARSKLWALLAGPLLGVPATSRNWTTVTSLLELAGA